MLQGKGGGSPYRRAPTSTPATTKSAKVPESRFFEHSQAAESAIRLAFVRCAVRKLPRQDGSNTPRVIERLAAVHARRTRTWFVSHREEV